MSTFFVGIKIEQAKKIHGNTVNTCAKITTLSALLPSKSLPILQNITQGKKFDTPRTGAMASKNAPKAADFVLKARTAVGTIISNMGARKIKAPFTPAMDENWNASHHEKQAAMRKMIGPRTCIKC
ncbi:hypothetical protein ACO0LG_16020 [Undibacterium sp. Ji42W]|uniref:hypothetical protein n=1 Tax=Undibacterium sp. Ji42W TaxID=3413039 RepID=UPI003BF32482